MSLKTSWPLRCALALLTAQLVSACGEGGPSNPNPQPGPDTAAPATRATPAGGGFGSTVAVALVCDDGAGSGCDATYYTLDGSAPTSGSPRYREPFTLGATTTVRFFSVDKAGNAEAAKSEQYTLTGARDTTPPTTAANPPGGSLNSPRSVALVCQDGAGTGCAATFYTLDGSVPTEASPRYSAPLAISTSTTLRFFSVDVAGNTEGVKTERYALDTQGPMVAASPRGGTYGASLGVTLTCDDGTGSGCGAIHYTTDGSIPSTASPAYAAPLNLQATTRLRFFAVDRAGNASEVVTEQYTLDGTGPVSTATPRGGTFRSAFSVALACDDGTGSGCAATYYTVNGGAPTRESPRYLAPIAIAGSATLRFFSVDAMNNAGPVATESYVVDTAAPTTQATPAGRSYAGEQLVTLTCDDGTGSGCAATYYTLDGSVPTASSPLYVAPVRVSSSLTLRFFSVDVAGNVEGARGESYVIDTTPPVTTASPAGATYRAAQDVTLTCNDGGGVGCGGIRYTTDPSAPVSSFLQYTAPIRVAANTQLRFFSSDTLGNTEAVKTQAYVIDTAVPTVAASPRGGTYRAPRAVTLTCGDVGSGCAGIFFTRNGDVPTPSSERYEAALSLTTDTTLRFIALDGAGNSSGVVTETYVLSSDATAPVTTVSPAGGSYTSAQQVTLTCTDNAGGTGCNGTFYTLDGSEPTTGSTRYTVPFTLSASAQLRFFSVDGVGNAEPVKSASYVIDMAPPLTRATPAGGSFQDPFNVTLACTDAGAGCAVTRYTTDGSLPTDASPQYTRPIAIVRNTTLRFFSVDNVGNAEPVRMESYSLPVSTDPASAQIASVRGSLDGSAGMSIDGAYITYVKPGAGDPRNDPAGFFLQVERAGPALFVVADPNALFPRPEAGMLVSVTVNNKRMVNGMVRVDLGDYAVWTERNPLTPLVQNVSNVDVPAEVREFEAELITLTGTINGAFAAAGDGHSQAQLVTAGVPSAPLFRLRVVESVRDLLNLTQGCTVSIVSPLWFFQLPQSPITTQPSVWTPEQVTAQTCPGPRAASAQALGAGRVSVRFDRNLDGASVLSNGSQFSIPGLTVTQAFFISSREVWLNTSAHVARQSYTVTVASTVRDTVSTGVEPTGNTARFTGWETPALLRFTEFATNMLSSRDLMEFVVVQGGTVRGMTVTDAGIAATLATFPDVTVSRGDVIVVHLLPDPTTPGADAPRSETLTRTEFPQAQFASNFDSAWDFHGSTTAGLTNSNRVYRILDPGGAPQDAIAVINPVNNFQGYPAQFQVLQAEGLWVPAHCNGAPCTYTSSPTIYDIAVNWSPAFSGAPGTGTTLGRVSFNAPLSEDNWAVGTGSIGFASLP
jgi:hypothetical protein